MKIGIITYHWVPNFGANLQALATVSVLKHYGHEVYLINYRPPALVEKFDKTIAADQLKIHDQFLNEYIPQTELCENLQDVEKLNDQYAFDLLISGSDAVFRLNHNINREDTTFPNPFWLTFAKPGQRKMYLSASSMGTDFKKLPLEVRRNISQLFDNSEYVLVRDFWTFQELSKISSAKIDQSIDPVFLLNKYFEIPDEYRFNHGKPYILINFYKGVAKSAWINAFISLCEAKGFDVLSIPNPEDNSFKSVFKFDLPLHPLTWYSAIQNSSGYIGMRFHPIVVAISNQVPFLAFDNYQTRLFNRMTSKTYDLAKKTGNAQSCVNKIDRKFLSPGRAFRKLMKKNNDLTFIHTEIEKLDKIFERLNSEDKATNL